MKRKTIVIIQTVLAAAALTYIIAPDLIVGPFDDAAIFALIGCAEVVLAIVQARLKASDSGQNYDNQNYQHNTNNANSDNRSYHSYSNNSDYHNEGSNHDSDDPESEFQFFAGCNDWEQVKTRYRDLMKIYHPDAGGNEEASKKINAEYNALKAKFGKQ